MEEKKNYPSKKIQVLSISILIFSLSFFLCSLAYLSYNLAKNPAGRIILPGGITYLGPTPTPASGYTAGKPTPAIPQGTFTADDTIAWKTWSGTVFPYRFSYPQTLPLQSFQNDPLDSVGIVWGKLPANQNILLSVITLSSNTASAPYAAKPKIEFVQNWWKEFPGLKGVKTIEPFTNRKGLKGYKARFINSEGKTPNLDIFFEVPENPKLIIRVANGILDDPVFEKIVESVEWKNK